MNGLKFAFLLIFSVLLITSCSEKTQEVQPEIGDPEILELITEAEALKFEMNSGRIFRTTSLRDRERIRATIDRIYTAGAILDQEPHNKSALISLKSTVQFYESLFITERDQPRVEILIKKGRNLLVKYAAIQGVDLAELQWEIYSYRFSNDVTPFGSTEAPNPWTIQFVQQERYAVRVRGENKTAPLLSPTFDLTNVKNPAFALRHSFQVEEHFIPREQFDRNLIMEEAFNIYGSIKFKDKDADFNTTTVSGNTVSTVSVFGIEDGAIVLKEIVSRNTVVNSMEVCESDLSIDDLSPEFRCYTENKPVARIVTENPIDIPVSPELSLALRHDTIGGLNPKDVSFIIADYIDGKPLDEYEWERVSLSFPEKKEWDFNQQKFFNVPEVYAGRKVLVGFEMRSENPKEEWDLYYAALSSKKDDGRWQRLWSQSFDRNGTNGLVDLSSYDPRSTFRLTEHKVDQFKNPRIWKRLPMGKLPLGLNFNTVESGLNSLEEFAGKKVVLAFVYRNGADLFNHQLSWAIERFELYGLTDELKVTPRPIPFNPDSQDGMGAPVWRHNFSDIQIGGLQQVTIEGNPSLFRNDERNGDKWVRGGNIDTQGTQLLYTDPIDLGSAVAPAIRIFHTLNFYTGIYKQENDVRLQVALDEPSKAIEELNWQVVDFEMNNPTGGDWNQYKSEFVKLPSNLIGKTIRVGWYHRSRDKSSPAWQILDTEIRDIPEL